MKAIKIDAVVNGFKQLKNWWLNPHLAQPTRENTYWLGSMMGTYPYYSRYQMHQTFGQAECEKNAEQAN